MKVPPKEARKTCNRCLGKGYNKEDREEQIQLRRDEQERERQEKESQLKEQRGLAVVPDRQLRLNNSQQADELARAEKARVMVEAAKAAKDRVRAEAIAEGEACHICNGAGKVRESRGLLQLRKTCRHCEGIGFIIPPFVLLELTVAMADNGNILIIAYDLAGEEQVQLDVSADDMTVSEVLESLAQSVSVSLRFLSVFLPNGFELRSEESMNAITDLCS